MSSRPRLVDGGGGSSLSSKSSLRSKAPGSSSLGSTLSSLSKPSSSSSVLQTSLVIGGGTTTPAPAPAPAPVPAPSPPSPAPAPPAPKQVEEDNEEDHDTNVPPPTNTMDMDDLTDALPSTDDADDHETTTHHHSHPQYAPPTVNPTMKQRFEEIPNENVGEDITATTMTNVGANSSHRPMATQHPQYGSSVFTSTNKQRWEEVPTDLHHAYTFAQDGNEQHNVLGTTAGGPIRSKMNFVDSEEPMDDNHRHYPGGPGSGGGGGSSKQRWEEVPTDLHHAYTFGNTGGGNTNTDQNVPGGPIRSKMNFVDSDEVPEDNHHHHHHGGGGSNASKQRWEEVPTDLHHAYTFGANNEPIRSKMNYKQSEDVDPDEMHYHPSSNSRPMTDGGGGGKYASSSNAGGASKQRWEEVPTDLHHAYTVGADKVPIRSKGNYKETDAADFDDEVGGIGHSYGRGPSSSSLQHGQSSSLKKRWEEVPTDLHHAYTFGANKEAVQSKMNYKESEEQDPSTGSMDMSGIGGGGHRGPAAGTKQRWDEIPTDLHHAYTFGGNNNEGPGKVGAKTLSQYVVDSEEQPELLTGRGGGGGSSLKQRWEGVPTDLHHTYTISGNGQQPQQGGQQNHGVQDAAMQQRLQDEYDDRILERMEGVEDHGAKSPLVVIDGANIAYAYADAKYAMQSVESSLESSGKGRREPDTKGIEVAANYFLESGTRVLVVLPAPWFRAKPRPGDTSKDNAMMVTPQLEILNDLKAKGMLVASPPTDDDDAYAIMIARREDSRSKKRLAGNDSGGFVLSNDMFRDAVHRDGMELKEWLKSGSGNGPGRISFAFCDMGSMDDYGDKIMDFVPNPVHPLVDYIETQSRK